MLRKSLKKDLNKKRINTKDKIVAWKFVDGVLLIKLYNGMPEYRNGDFEYACNATISIENGILRLQGVNIRIDYDIVPYWNDSAYISGYIDDMPLYHRFDSKELAYNRIKHLHESEAEVYEKEVREWFKKKTIYSILYRNNHPIKKILADDKLDLSSTCWHLSQ